MKGAGADFHVVGLKDDAALVGPVALQYENEFLESARRAAGWWVFHGPASINPILQTAGARLRYHLALKLCMIGRCLHHDGALAHLSLIHISEPTRLGMISYAVFCLK